MCGSRTNLIEIPKNALVVLCGPAASGKTIFATKHFAPTQVISTDRCRALVGDDESNQAISGRAFDVFYRVIEHRVALGRLTIADSTALSARTRRNLRRLGHKYNRPVVLILFNLGIRLCARNDARRERRVGIHVIRDHRKKFLDQLRVITNESYLALYRLDANSIQDATVRIIPA